MSFRVLVTAFEPFGGRAENASRAILQALPAGPDTLVLPVVYDLSAEIFLKKLRSQTYDLVLALGEAPEPHFRIETLAHNRDDAESADLAGVLRKGSAILADAPSSIPSRLPAEAIFKALQLKGIPVELSHSAGGYICNHIFYHLMNEFRVNPAYGQARGGFLHVPIDWCSRAPEGAAVVHEVIRVASQER